MVSRAIRGCSSFFGVVREAKLIKDGVLGVPYSEHSSFFELTCFALSLPGADLKMIATVNVGNEKK